MHVVRMPSLSFSRLFLGVKWQTSHCSLFQNLWQTDQISYKGAGTDGTPKQIQKFRDRLIGAFIKCLAYSAKRHLDPEKGRISYDTATG